jgi:DNA-binding transcriptional ArsR family regulator
MVSKIDKRLLWWVFSVTSGGPVRAKIIELLKDRPSNPNQISKELKLSYPTIRYHLNILQENKMVDSTKGTSITMYYLTDEMIESYSEFLKILKMIKESKTK